MKTTPEWGLKLPEYEDYADIADITSNFENIESIVINITQSNEQDMHYVDEILYKHKNDFDNPHSVTKAQVGLGSVPNLNTTQAVSYAHTHGNKSLLDTITEAFTTTLKTAYDIAVTWVSGIKNYVYKQGNILNLQDRILIGTLLSEGNIGQYSMVQGLNCSAPGQASHAEGVETIANGNSSHAEGYGTIANANSSHAEGIETTAIGYASHAECDGSTANGYGSHSEGVETIANGNSSHAEGRKTQADGICEHTQGRYNRLSGANPINWDSTGDAFIIGNGDIGSVRSNSFRTTNDGRVYGLSAFNSTGADYAEWFEWLDGNPGGGERLGLFVTLDGEKIRIANDTDDYILGVVSANPSSIGNSDTGQWYHMHLRDKWGRFIIEDVEVDDGTETQLKLNPEYDPKQDFVPRDKRPEWAAVGMLGQLYVCDDGTCEVNGYCMPDKDGIATKADKGYRVIAKKKDLVKIILK